MKIKDLEKYIDKKVRVSFTDGETIVGEFDSIAPYYDTESGKDEIEIFSDGRYILEPIDKVDRISLVK